MRLRTSQEQASVLVGALCISALLTLSLIAYITFVSGQHKLAVRSQSWNGALVMAESGIEEALTHINFTGTTNFGSDGWTQTGAAYRKTRTLGDGYFWVAISTSSPPTISSTGFVTTPIDGSYISRAVQITTTNVPRTKGLISRTKITMSGSSYIDSFDSVVTGGQYKTNQATDLAYVAAGSSAKPAIKAISIYGEVATGPGGTVAVSGDGIGDKAWVDSAPATIEPGHFKDDFNATFDPVVAPDSGGFFVPPNGTVNGTNYLYVLNGGDFVSSSVNMGGGKYTLIQGNNRWLVNGDFVVSGGAWVWMDPGATLELYVGGKASVSGSGFVNTTQKTTSLSLFGLPTCTQIDYSGASLFIGIIYAPSAKLTISGGGGGSGSAVANQIDLSGGANFHCDTALYGNSGGGTFTIISWDER